MEQMTASIARNTENAKVTDGMAAKAACEAAEGGEVVGRTVEDMKTIAGRISIIDDIAYQNWNPQASLQILYRTASQYVQELPPALSASLH